MRSAVFLYSAPPSVVPIAARPFDSPDSGPAAFQMPCTAPFTDNLYALPVFFRRGAQLCQPKMPSNTVLDSSNFSREGKAEFRLPHGAGKGIRAMHSSHFIVARHIQEYKKIFLFPDAVLSILFHSTGRRSPGTEGFSASAKDPGLQKAPDPDKCPGPVLRGFAFHIPWRERNPLSPPLPTASCRSEPSKSYPKHP